MLKRRARFGLIAGLVSATALGVTASLVGPVPWASSAVVSDAEFLQSIGLPSTTPIVDVACAPVGDRCTGSIQSAVNSIPAGRSTVVRVAPGIYHQSVLIEAKTIHLVGAMGDNPVWIDGFGVSPVAGSQRYGVSLRNAPDSSLRHFAVRRFTSSGPENFPSAVRVEQSNRALVDGVTVVDNSYSGIGTYRSNDVVFDHLLIQRNDAIGVSAWMSDRFVLRNSVIESNTDTATYQALAEQYRESAGVKITESGNVLVDNNLVQNNGSTGIWTDVGTHDSVISNNRSINNLWHGIETEISARISVQYNTVLANADGNSPFQSPRHGILVLDSSDIWVMANTVRHRKGDTDLGWSQAFRIAETPSRPVHPRIGQPPTDSWNVIVAYNVIEELSADGSVLGFYDERGLRSSSDMLSVSDANYLRRAPGAALATDTTGKGSTATIGRSDESDQQALRGWQGWRCANNQPCRAHNSVLVTVR